MATRSQFQLYYSVRSPFARRVRIALERLNIDFVPKEMNVFEPSAEFLAVNPLGMVPALVVNTGAETLSIPDSATILEYLHEHYGEKIWPSDLLVRAQVRVASTLAEGLMSETVRHFLENQRASPSAEWNQEYLDNIERTLTLIEKMGLKGLPWKYSDLQMTQAGYDLMVALQYMQLRLKVYHWAVKFPELSKFVELHKNRQDLSSTLPPA